MHGLCEGMRNPPPPPLLHPLTNPRGVPYWYCSLIELEHEHFYTSGSHEAKSFPFPSDPLSPPSHSLWPTPQAPLSPNPQLSYTFAAPFSSEPPPQYKQIFHWMIIISTFNTSQFIPSTFMRQIKAHIPPNNGIALGRVCVT